MSRLQDSGLGIGGAVRDGNQLVETTLDMQRGEGISGPMNPYLSLVRRAVKLLVGALCLKRSAGKVVITIDDPKPDNGLAAWLVALMSLLGVVLLCCGMMLGRHCWTHDGASPRIQSMRADETSRSDWSVLSSAELRERNSSPRSSESSNSGPSHTQLLQDMQEDDNQGIRRRTRRSPTLANPAAQTPGSYPNPSRNQPTEVRGSPQAQGMSRNPQGPPDYPNPDPYDPRYLEPPNQPPSDAPGDNQLGSARSERGQSRRVPPSRPAGSSTVAEQQRDIGITEIRGDGALVGAIASHLDDLLYVGQPEYVPWIPEDTGDSDCLREHPGEQLERHTSEEEGLSRAPISADAVDTTVAPEVRAGVAEFDQQDRPALRLCVYPGWTLRVPPRETWPPMPDWGGAEALWHQRIPTTTTKDFTYWSQDRGVLLRLHAAPRRRLYIPAEATLPRGITRLNLTGRRRTFVRFLNPVELEIVNDNMSEARAQRQLRRAWTGRTEFELRFP